MQPTVLLAAERRAGTSFIVPIVFFVVAFLAYVALLVLRDGWIVQAPGGTRTMPVVPLLLITVARALVPALFVGFSSRFYANLHGARAAALAAAIFVIGIFWETVFPFIKAAASADLGMFLAMLGLAAFGILTALVMAYFIRYFRKPHVWAIFLLLWTAGGIMPPAPDGYLFIAIRSVALAALGYWLQRAGAISAARLAAAFD